MALSRARELAADVVSLTSDYPGLPRFAKAAAGLVTYIDNNAAAIPDYGERRRYAEQISTAFTESTVNLVVGKRFARKQQMQWSKAGANLLLQTRTQTLDGTLRETFRKWYPAMAANDTQTPVVAASQPEHPIEFYALSVQSLRIGTTLPSAIDAPLMVLIAAARSL